MADKYPDRLRVLFCYDIAGRLSEVEEIVCEKRRGGEEIDFVLASGRCIGEDFHVYVGDDAPSKISVPIYFIDSAAKEHIEKYEGVLGSEGAHRLKNSNLYFLGACGAMRIKLSSRPDVCIAYLSGRFSKKIWDHPQDKKFHGINYTSRAIGAVKRQAEVICGGKIDILLTSEWPQQFWSTSKNAAWPAPVPEKCASGAVWDLFTAIKPRYHFCGGAERYMFRQSPQGTFNFTSTLLALVRMGASGQWHQRLEIALGVVAMPEVEMKRLPGKEKRPRTSIKPTLSGDVEVRNSPSPKRPLRHEKAAVHHVPRHAPYEPEVPVEHNIRITGRDQAAAHEQRHSALQANPRSRGITGRDQAAADEQRHSALQAKPTSRGTTRPPKPDPPKAPEADGLVVFSPTDQADDDSDASDMSPPTPAGGKRQRTSADSNPSVPQDDDFDTTDDANSPADAAAAQPAASIPEAAKVAVHAEPEVPHGWQVVWSKSKERTYYFHLASGKTSWVMPSAQETL